MTLTPASAGAGVVVSGIVLAAGASRRMGRPKALLSFRGRTFLDSVLDLLLSGGCARAVVVLGHDADALRATAGLDRRPDIRVVVNAEWEQGQFTSVQAAIRALSAPLDPPADAALLALVDQPHIPASVVHALIERFRETRAPLIRPTVDGRGGHPVLISRALFAEILTSPSTATLYDIFQSHATERIDVPVDSPEIREDFDLPEDLGRLG